MLRMRSISLIALLACTACGVIRAAQPSAQQVEFFEKQIRPILADRCYECHSAEKKQKGGLTLDTSEAVLKGGDRPPYSPTPIPVLTAHGAAGAKANS